MGFFFKASLFGVFLGVLGFFVIKFPETYSHVEFESCKVPAGKVEKIESKLVEGVTMQSPIHIPAGEYVPDEKRDYLVADLYKPRMDSKVNPFFDQKSKTTAAIVLAHGLGGTRDMGLYRFAQEFANAGLLTLVFDYR